MSGESIAKAATTFGHLPVARQLVMLIGLSASIALGFYVVLWSQSPNYRPLFTNLTTQEAGEVLDSLQATGIQYKVDQKSGSILVPSKKVYDVRLELASQGLPHKTGVGFDALEQDSGIGRSRFMESARYRHALEGELARTISDLQDVHSARVHLALPKDSVFVDDHRKATASVFLDVVSGRKIGANEVGAIAHLISSSVNNMQSEDVSIVDQEGRLLSGDGVTDDLAKSKEQFEYRSQIENKYVKRIESMLAPLLGAGKIRARVSADIDFTRVEQTQENYLPDNQVLRSEQVSSDSSSMKHQGPSGVPGALSNQPPTTADNANQAGNQEENTMRPVSSHATRNYELGKRISHTELPVGVLKHLSVAVVIDELSKVDAKTGEVTKTPLSEEQMKKITNLVENAVGYDPQRGDKLSVENIPFIEAAAVEELPPLPVWQQDWFWEVIKMSLGALFVLLLLFTVIKPVLKNLSNKEVPDPPAMDPNMMMMPQMMQPGTMQPGMMQQQGGAPNINQLQQIAKDDPKKIAQVMKTWVGDNNG